MFLHMYENEIKYDYETENHCVATVEHKKGIDE